MQVEPRPRPIPGYHGRQTWCESWWWAGWCRGAGPLWPGTKWAESGRPGRPLGTWGWRPEGEGGRERRELERLPSTRWGARRQGKPWAYAKQGFFFCGVGGGGCSGVGVVKKEWGALSKQIQLEYQNDKMKLFSRALIFKKDECNIQQKNPQRSNFDM